MSEFEKLFDPSAVGEAATRAVARDATRPLPKRFYNDVTVGDSADAFAVLLDGRRVKTPGKRDLALADRGLAARVAAEWAAQIETIDPAKMPLTRLVFTAIDAVAGAEAGVAADVVKYAGSDLLCYRAEAPEELVAVQARHWDPVVGWADEALGARFVVGSGLMPIRQDEAAMAAIGRAIEGLPALKLTGLHVLTTLMGSALLAVAVHKGKLTFEEAWAAAHVDEDWQIALWGEDGDAMARRAVRLAEARAAATVLAD